ncbi:MAG: hypothetical protein ACJ74Z_19965 [Bryobacteraceae bacterium]|jgi:hypothetical protein
MAANDHGKEEGREAAKEYLESVYDRSWLYQHSFTDAPENIRILQQAQNWVQHEADSLSRGIRNGQYPQEILERHFPETGEPSREFQSGMRLGLSEWAHGIHKTLDEQIELFSRHIEAKLGKETPEIEQDFGISF